MPRNMTGPVAAALCAPAVRIAILAAMQFADNLVRVWSGLGPLTLTDGTVFQGVGTLGDVGTISEDSSVEAKGVTLSLSSIPSDTMSEILSEMRLLGKVQVWLAVFDESGAIIPDPVLIYQGNMDTGSITDAGDTCTATIAVENVLVDLNRDVFRRYTNDDQQSEYPGDTAMQYVAGLQEQITFWGKSPSSVNNV